MRKIGILTFHTAENYGAVLQAYALQTYLRENFPMCEVKIIDFKTEDHLQSYRIFNNKRSDIVKKLALDFLTILKYQSLKVRKKRFKSFTSEELALTQRFSSEHDLLTNIPQMDFYITGSDQVFNPNNKFFLTYYLAFNKRNAVKIAYAPSFGINNFTKNVREKVETYLKDFDALSCRESTGANFISEIVGKQVPTVCDPVFLIGKAAWKKISAYPNVKYKYIFVYDLNGGQKLIKIANKIKKMTGYKIICLTQSVQRFYKADKILYSSGPREFLGLLSNSEIIVTDSFHGITFSIIFRKEFYVYIASEVSSSRISTFLEFLEIENRIIKPEEIGKFSIIPFKINYIQKLENLINTSSIYLFNALQPKL